MNGLGPLYPAVVSGVTVPASLVAGYPAVGLGVCVALLMLIRHWNTCTLGYANVLWLMSAGLICLTELLAK